MSRCTFTARAFLTGQTFGCIALFAGVALASCADTSTTDSPSAADHGAYEPRSATKGLADDDDRLAEGAAGSGEVPEAAAGSDPQSAGVAALDPALPSYEVPVSVALADFSRYRVESVQWRERNGERRLQYDLPADLIGHAQRVEFSGPASSGSSWSLRSDKFGQAACEQTGAAVVCHETLSGIEIDVDAVEARVNAGELDPGRLGVTRVFEADPIGILRFTVP